MIPPLSHSLMRIGPRFFGEDDQSMFRSSRIKSAVMAGPFLCRPSTPYIAAGKKDVDGRDWARP